MGIKLALGPLEHVVLEGCAIPEALEPEAIENPCRGEEPVRTQRLGGSRREVVLEERAATKIRNLAVIPLKVEEC
jgi:hypothetical protein